MLVSGDDHSVTNVMMMIMMILSLSAVQSAPTLLGGGGGGGLLEPKYYECSHCQSVLRSHMFFYIHPLCSGDGTVI